MGMSMMPVQDGPTVPEFHPQLLAKAIDHEIARATENGWTKIMLNMDLLDAMKLSQVLKRS